MAEPAQKRSRIEESAKQQGGVILKISEGFSKNASKFKLLEATPDIRNTLSRGDKYVFTYVLLIDANKHTLMFQFNFYVHLVALFQSTLIEQNILQGR